MNVSNKIKAIIVENGIKQVYIGEKLGYTRQGFNNMLNKDSSKWKIEDIEKVLDVLGYDLKIEFVKREQ